jgi:hypothetical protein
LIGKPNLSGVLGDQLLPTVVDFFTTDDLDQQKVTANLDVFTRTKLGKGLRRRDANQATMCMVLLAGSALEGGQLHVAVQAERFPWWFLVGYPDVVTWLRLKTQSELEHMAGANKGAELLLEGIYETPKASKGEDEVSFWGSAHEASSSIANLYSLKGDPALRLSAEFLMLYSKLNKLCVPVFTAAGSPQQPT